MTIRRPRLTVRSMMALVAIAAAMLAWAARPHPAQGLVTPNATYVAWSDGSPMTQVGDRKLAEFRRWGRFLAVDWPDGSTSYYFAHTAAPAFEGEVEVFR